MTDNEIIKALELCLAEKSTKQTCGKCPYHQFGKLCKVERSKDALDLINRQNAEIAVLSMKNAELEVENKAKDVFMDTVLPNLIKNAKTEAVRGFSVAVQDAFAEYFKIDEIPVCYVIDKILGVEEAKIKELVGDAECTKR